MGRKNYISLTAEGVPIVRFLQRPGQFDTDRIPPWMAVIQENGLELPEPNVRIFNLKRQPVLDQEWFAAARA
jgi:hypothetical protein